MKKYYTIALLILSLLALASCSKETAVLDENKTYEITSGIHSINILIDAGDFKIERGNEFSVKSNLKHLSVSEKNGVLSIVEEQKYKIHDTDAALMLQIPDDIVFETVDITTGAAKLTADSLSADSLKLKLGAGKVEFGCLNAYSNIDVEGGVGEITVTSGTLNNLSLTLGVGKLDMTAALFGNSVLEFGVGESNLKLLGNRNDYKADIEKGLGSITIDGKAVSDSVSNGNGQHHIKIAGGVGAVNITFQEE